MHRELLRLARVLASDAVGNPRWVARSRAVSTAYYALFHALAELCARELVGAWRPWEPFRHIYRSLDHGQARRVLNAARGEPGSSDALKTISGLFVDLQERRHLADYDRGYRITASDTLALIDGVERSLGLLDGLSPGERKSLAARLIGRTRG